MFYLLIKALKYESVNADSDPKKVLREKFDPARKHEIEQKEQRSLGLQQERRHSLSGHSEMYNIALLHPVPQNCYAQSLCLMRRKV